MTPPAVRELYRAAAWVVEVEQAHALGSLGRRIAMRRLDRAVAAYRAAVVEAAPYDGDDDPLVGEPVEVPGVSPVVMAVLVGCMLAIMAMAVAILVGTLV